jgi:hypothetical protein
VVNLSSGAVYLAGDNNGNGNGAQLSSGRRKRASEKVRMRVRETASEDARRPLQRVPSHDVGLAPAYGRHGAAVDCGRSATSYPDLKLQRPFQAG